MHQPSFGIRLQRGRDGKCRLQNLYRVTPPRETCANRSKLQRCYTCARSKKDSTQYVQGVSIEDGEIDGWNDIDCTEYTEAETRLQLAMLKACTKRIEEVIHSMTAEEKRATATVSLLKKHVKMETPAAVFTCDASHEHWHVDTHVLTLLHLWSTSVTHPTRSRSNS